MTGIRQLRFMNILTETQHDELSRGCKVYPPFVRRPMFRNPVFGQEDAQLRLPFRGLAVPPSRLRFHNSPHFSHRQYVEASTFSLAALMLEAPQNGQLVGLGACSAACGTNVTGRLRRDARRRAPIAVRGSPA